MQVKADNLSYTQAWDTGEGLPFLLTFCFFSTSPFWSPNAEYIFPIFILVCLLSNHKDGGYPHENVDKS